MRLNERSTHNEQISSLLKKQMLNDLEKNSYLFNPSLKSSLSKFASLAPRIITNRVKGLFCDDDSLDILINELDIISSYDEKIESKYDQISDKLQRDIDSLQSRDFG